MISVQDAFKEFASRLELTKPEQEDASRRQKEIRAYLDEKFHIDHDFLTGSYKRWTKTKPLKDVDIFCCLAEEENHYRKKHPSEILGAFEDALVPKYGRQNVTRKRRSVSVGFGSTEEEERVMSFDVVPAFPKGDHYEIPDTADPREWTETDPRIHEDRAKEANDCFSGEWKRIVRMAKKWNDFHNNPVKPSFLIEVMALDLLDPPFGGDYRRELKAFFASMADGIDREWMDPAGLGPPVSDTMDLVQQAEAKQALHDTERSVTSAMRLEERGSNGEALRAWRDQVFGPLFPLS